ncbi:hypothetical protein ACI2VF_15005 [Ralstonia nicotianae]
MQWLGQGETDWCQLCGAEYEHWADECKQPLDGWPLSFLLQAARDVEGAYVDTLRLMTQEQVANNRLYQKRLIAAIASSSLYYIEDRSVESLMWRNWEDMRLEAAELFEEIGPAGTGHTFYKYVSTGLGGGRTGGNHWQAEG